MLDLPYTQLFITRPQVQNAALKVKLEEAFLKSHIHIPVIDFPLLKIIPTKEHPLARNLSDSLQKSSWVHVVSPNALIVSDQLLKSFHFDWPKHLSFALIGAGTEQTLKSLQIPFEQIVQPFNEDHWDSEGLWEALQMTGIDWNGIQITWIAGDGGRTFLQEHLDQAGAKISERSEEQTSELQSH